MTETTATRPRNMKILHIEMEQELLEKVKALAGRERRTLRAQVELMLEQQLKSQGRKERRNGA